MWRTAIRFSKGNPYLFQTGIVLQRLASKVAHPFHQVLCLVIGQRCVLESLENLYSRFRHARTEVKKKQKKKRQSALMIEIGIVIFLKQSSRVSNQLFDLMFVREVHSQTWQIDKWTKDGQTNRQRERKRASETDGQTSVMIKLRMPLVTSNFLYSANEMLVLSGGMKIVS